MRRGALVLAAALALAAPAVAAPKPDPEDAAALATVDRFFLALAKSDDVALAGLILPDGVITVQAAQEDGSWKLRRLPMAQWAERLKGKPGFDERIWSPKLMRRGPLAVVWAPYKIESDPKGHCGVDSFDLVRTEGGWKVASLSWTVEPKACAELGWKRR